MPVQVSYPGVYIEELSSGVHTITGVATSITAFLGRAQRGPVNQPVTIFNFGDFERSFGGLAVSDPMSYAVRDFYLNGGNQAIIVRLYKGVPSTASLTVDGMQLSAASPGTWGNSLHVVVDHDGITDDVAQQYGLTKNDLFNLSVFQKPAGGGTNILLEKLINLSVTDNTRRADRILAQQSQYVVVALDVNSQPILPGAVPAAGLVADGVGGADSGALGAGEFIGAQATKTGIYALDQADLFNLLCIPPDTRGGDVDKTVYQAAMKYCADRRAMLIVDPPANWSANKATAASKAAAGLATDLNLSGLEARNAALYFPRVVEADPLRDGQLDSFVPCGIVAGVMTRTDTQRGVWKAPAGLDATINGIQGLDVNLTDSENGLLNPLGINCLRFFPINGRVVWGARTLRGADQLADEYKYVPVRRLALYIEESLYRGTQWVVFEPNDEPLWAQIRLNVGAFMQNLFRQGAFQGRTPREAYLVKCDSETTTQNDINLGIVNILVGFAPLKPAEFVIIKIQQLAGQIDV